METKQYLKHVMKNFLQAGFLTLIFNACNNSTPKESTTEQPNIFPDYKDIVIPCNIAPTNFMIEGATKIAADFYLEDRILFTTNGSNTIEIPQKEWQETLKQAKGKYLKVVVSVWNKQHQEGIKFRDFKITVSNDSITPWIAYRLIPPGYVLWKTMGIYQRHLENFEEDCIVSNNENHGGCVNCHSFQNFSPKKFLFHARGKNGCSVLVENGKPERLELEKIDPYFKGTYPYWHPKGRFIVLANCDTHQAFYGESNNKVEVYDLESDLMIYDSQEHKVITDPRFTEKQYWETFPAFSPDGKDLYFCQAHARNIPKEYAQLKYAILRADFNEANGALGKVDTIYNPHTDGGSASFPRVSPDGRFLLFTESESGTFPIWHKQADLKMIDLKTKKYVDTTPLNSKDVDSYHSWDQNGKWVIFSSRRLDGRYTRLFMAHFDPKKGFSKPFLLPQENPEHNNERMYSYNIPEFVNGRISLEESVAHLFE